ncbi:PhoH family protein [Pedobacter sp. SYP-B3415]|uniref:PhoH family protein n=1 Tax=Pedobacter sp. SYP-B3415 TaxID=2496641 RepID=UPI00101C53C2|nr:PhoH family protein [Pedobacter sp. SYP-B3415]
MAEKKTGNRPDNQRKIFVLDTSVILYDHNAINSFMEHDVAVPVQVLEELDNFKNGNETRNFEARSFFRLIDRLSGQHLISEWIPLSGSGSGQFKIALDEQPEGPDAARIFGNAKADHRILNSALVLKERYPAQRVVLVSKDIGLRLKAKSLELQAEDYETGKVKNVEELYTGRTICKNFPLQLFEAVRAGAAGGDAVRAALPVNDANHFYTLRAGRKGMNAYFSQASGTLIPVHNRNAFNITPRNPEQAFAMHALLDPALKLVTIQGNAGTGKTLLALACALEQRKDFRQIYVTRPIVPLSNKDIGYLPGDVKSKIDPYMAPIWDNLRFIREQFTGDDKTAQKIDELVSTDKITISPLAFIRGRTLTKIFFIIDEAQNLTPHEVKTIISRAGEGTKIIFTGDIYQIDTPYLDTASNGLSYLIDNARNHPLYAHITLQKGERSELANLATELL